MTPDSLKYDNIKDFKFCPKNLQYVWSLQNDQDKSIHGQLLKVLVNEETRNKYLSITAEHADINFDNFRNNFGKKSFGESLINLDNFDNVNKEIFNETIYQNLQILEQYIKLCLENGAKPIGVVLPFAPAMVSNYDRDFLAFFRYAIGQLSKIYNFRCIDLFGLQIGYRCFYDMTHLNFEGSMIVSDILSAFLHNENFLPIENLTKANYQFFYNLSNFTNRNFYNSLMDKVFKVTTERLRRKNKINVGFVLYDASMWCGDDLYNLFARNPRYNVTIFLCLRTDKYDNPKVIEEFQKGVENFRAKGLNIVGVSEFNQKVPHQDLLLYLSPYQEVLPKVFKFHDVTAETLLTYIPYCFNERYENLNFELQRVAWKFFEPVKTELENKRRVSTIGLPRSYYSGHPKMDVLYSKSANLKYKWKMAVPNARKIIWAPHWSIGNRAWTSYATFDHNYKFMLEFAKTHPEISWVFKPHPGLLFSAVESGVFSSREAFDEYLNEWNNLPNAKVETGAYYQAIFATSDGMILDSASFISEYQYTHKPMIFLTRDTQRFNYTVGELMKILYRVDGRDLKGIAKLMQKIFIEGNDELFAVRLKFFDEHFNYQKDNGILASEYIFKNITSEI